MHNHHKFKDNLGYIVSSKQGSAIVWGPVSINNQINQNLKNNSRRF